MGDVLCVRAEPGSNSRVFRCVAVKFAISWNAATLVRRASGFLARWTPNGVPGEGDVSESKDEMHSCQIRGGSRSGVPIGCDVSA